VVNEIVVAVPGDLATTTGGFGYDRRIIAELAAIGWKIQVLDLGSGFPRPTAQMRAAASTRLAALPRQCPVVIDGLAFGVLPETAEMLRESHRLVALVHHPLALETGLSADEAAHLHASEQSALACTRHVVVTSATTMRILAADFHVPIERLSVVEPGTDKVATRPRARKGVVALLSVGAVMPRKGYDVLGAALAKIKHLPWRLVIVGDCTRSAITAQLLRTQIAKLGLADRIILRGVVTADELASLYASSDLFVLPSRFEGYGMAFAEAIAHGVPVVGTKAGAIAQTVPDNAGVLVPVGDADALANALQRLIEKPQERERFAAGARAAIFPSWREQGARFARVLEGLA
jgi:glycosyltransferase involved in cell wall biosynthesis